MKRTIGLLAVSIAAVLLLGWMLTTPLLEINPAPASPAVADGNPPVPPPPYAALTIVLVADGNPPVPPPPYSAASGILVADGNPPVPPPPYNV